MRKIYPSQSKLSTSAIQWGKNNECIARQQYEQSLHDYKVYECGLHISQDGFLATSPDGIVCSAEGVPVGTLEIKCPFSQRNSTVVDACTKSTFFCEVKESTIHLKTNHN